MPPSMADVVHRYARVAAVVNRFYAELHGGDRRVVFPAEEVRAAFSRG